MPFFSNRGKSIRFYVKLHQDDVRQATLIEEQHFMVLNTGCLSQASKELLQNGYSRPTQML